MKRQNPYRVLALLAACLAIVLSASPGWAQGARGGGFSGNAPNVGDSLPDIEAVDADGQPLKLSSLKGHYTVLVFGCLT